MQRSSALRPAVCGATTLALLMGLAGVSARLAAQEPGSFRGFDAALPARLSRVGDGNGGGWRVVSGVPGGTPADLHALFTGTGGPAGSRGPGMRGTGMGALGLPSLLGQRGPALRFGASAGGLRLSYREMAGGRAAGQFGGFGAGSSSPAYPSSNFGNGMFNVSATTTYGGRQVTGSFGAGTTRMGNVPGGEKHAAPAVALKLSF